MWGIIIAIYVSIGLSIAIVMDFWIRKNHKRLVLTYGTIAFPKIKISDTLGTIALSVFLWPGIILAVIIRHMVESEVKRSINNRGGKL